MRNKKQHDGLKWLLLVLAGGVVVLGVVSVIYYGQKVVDKEEKLVEERMTDDVIENEVFSDVAELEIIELSPDSQVIVEKYEKWTDLIGQRIYDDGVIVRFDKHYEDNSGQIIGRLTAERTRLLKDWIDEAIDEMFARLKTKTTTWRNDFSGSLTIYNGHGDKHRIRYVDDGQLKVSDDEAILDFCLTGDCRDIVTEYIPSVADHQPLQERVAATIYSKTRDLGQLGEVVAFAYTRDDWDGIFGDGITSLIAYNKAGEAIRFYQGYWQVHSLSFADDKLYVFVREGRNWLIYEFDLSSGDYTPKKIASINDWSYLCENVIYCQEYGGYPNIGNLYVREGKLYFAGGEPWIYGETTDENWQYRHLVLDLSQSEYLDDAQVIESYRESDYWLSENERLFRVDNETKVVAGQTLGNLDTQTVGDLYYRVGGKDILLANRIATSNDRFNYCWPYGFELNGYVFFRSGGRSISRLNTTTDKIELVYVAPEQYLVTCLHNAGNVMEVGLRNVYDNERETIYVNFDGMPVNRELRELSGEPASLTNQNEDDWNYYGYPAPDDDVYGPFYLE